MPRHAPAIACSPEVRTKLVATSKSRTEETRAVERARIILASLEGKEIQQVARELHTSIPTVRKWRRRFSKRGLDGLSDQPRSGKPAKYGPEFRNRVLSLLEQPPPSGMSHWDGPTVGEKLGASVHAVWRILRREGIYLQRLRTWCVSTDPEFAAKAAEVVGLYLDLPVNALVLSVDEKPSIQALPAAFRLRGNRQWRPRMGDEEHLQTQHHVESFGGAGNRHWTGACADHGTEKARGLPTLSGRGCCGTARG